jgi:adenosylcobinamide-GDP ribazoletransferase
VRPLLIALQFLTRIPVALESAPTDEELGRSLLWYPWVGLLIGGLLWLCAATLGFATPMLRAAILLAIWIGVTGALHLDGLADCADAWIGGRGDRERMLAIMKDPYAGPIAVATIVAVLMLKFASLDALIEHGHIASLILPPLLARTALPALFLTTPYVRTQGLGAALAAHLPRSQVQIMLVLLALVIALILRRQGLISLASSAIVFFAMRHQFIRKLGGFTGDCAGAVAELVETVVLISTALVNTN